MGRGRQKAKDAKIARQLKYASHNQDISALERELIAQSAAEDAAAEEPSDDFYDRWADDDSDDDER